jgi:hypothetical protein
VLRALVDKSPAKMGKAHQIGLIGTGEIVICIRCHDTNISCSGMMRAVSILCIVFKRRKLIAIGVALIR